MSVKELLRPFLSRHQWFRKWHGGKWSLCLIDLPLSRNPLWLNTWDRPGCGIRWLKLESWPLKARP